MSYFLEDSHVFLTGATGLIGGEFARTLTRKYAAFVSCLVRGRDGVSSATRLKQRMTRCGESLNDLELERLAAVEGDVRLADFGADPKEFARLTDSVEIIVHAAAETSFIRSQNCEEINIEGTKRVIEFARKCRRKPLVVFISTACNIGDVSGKCLAEEEGCRPENEHHNAYTQTKAVAEALMRESGLPILIIRPSIVLSAGLSDPEFARQILWVAPLFNEFECLPINPRAKLDIVPVSFVVDATLKLVTLPERRFDCYHLSAGSEHCVELGKLTECINRHYGKTPLLRGIPKSDWKKEHMIRYVVTPEQRKLYFSFRYYLPFLNMDVVFDNSRLKKETDVEDLGLRHPTQYLPDLLKMVRYDDAILECENP